MQLKPIYTRAGEVEAAEGPRHAEMLEKNRLTKAACLTDAQLPLFGKATEQAGGKVAGRRGAI
jgi:hypothetical protein